MKVKIIYLLLVLNVIVLNANASEGTPQQSAQSRTCQFLGEELYGCKPFTCATFSAGTKETITQEIKGKNAEDLCVVEQKFESGEKVICSYEAESRKFMAIKMQDAKSGKIGKDRDDIEYAEALMQQIFENECVVYDAKGKVIKDVAANAKPINFKKAGKVGNNDSKLILEYKK